MSSTIDLRIDWLDAPRVSSPDLAATWAAYQLWIGGECVTYVETSDGDDRRSVFGSLYPLAEWIADNWWSLTSDLRPSALPSTVWGWAHSAERPWLMAHNTRGAGNGMAWPDLSIVPEGATTALTWRNDDRPTLGGLKFLRRGIAHAQSDQVSSALAGIVDRVLDRLQDKGVPAGPLGARWAAVAESANDPEETEFCVIAARLGLDPYAVDDDIADRLISVADRVPSSLRDDFFSSTREGMLEEGLEWLTEALPLAGDAAADAERDVAQLRREVTRGGQAGGAPHATSESPAWRIGYELARSARAVLGVPPEERFDISPWVGVVEAGSSAAGLQGVCATPSNRCGLALPRRSIGTQRRSGNSLRFSCARALGIGLNNPSGGDFILSPVGTHFHRVSRAFAAELLAPAEGISGFLAGGLATEEEIEDLAEHFEVSSRVIEHQYENQLC